MTAGQVQVCRPTLAQKAPSMVVSFIASNKASTQATITGCKILMKNTHAHISFLLSPGFYELSDGGSCSLSNSCTSVYSECLSSSQTSLLLLPVSPANSHISHPSQVDVCRRRSADESTTQPNPPRATGLHLGSSRIRASTTGTEHARPRPVSTGNPIS